MFIRTFLAIQRRSSSMARGDKTWSSAPFRPSRYNEVWWHTEKNMAICTFFAIQRQSSFMAHGDKTWSSTPFLWSRENQVRCHVKTKHGHPHLPCYLETIKSDSTRRQSMVIRTLFAIQRQSSSMARIDKHGHPHLFCYIETIKYGGTGWQIMVIRTFLAIQRQSSSMARRDKTCSSATFLQF